MATTDQTAMAREALLLLWQAGGRPPSPEQLPDGIRQHCRRASHMLDRYGPCPGFWAEVLAAVRVLSSCQYGTATDGRSWWLISYPESYPPAQHGMDDFSGDHEAPTEAGAILAALRAVVEVLRG